MILAKFKRNDKGIYAYDVTGHANSDEYGKDIICAGVSSLYISVTNTLTSLGRTFKRNEGYFVIDGQVKEEVALQILFDGIKAIENEYPDFVKVEVIEDESTD